MKYLYTALGFLSLAIGCAGIVIRGLPTTPFVLLSASLFAKSSDRWYNWLVSNRIFGRIIRQFAEEKGMTLRVKAASIALMWFMITISVLTLSSWKLKLAIAILGIIGTIVMGFVVRTVPSKKSGE